MHTSWEQHKTLVQVQSQNTVGEIFDKVGDPIELNAQEPLLIDKPLMSWFVEEGAVDLFFVDLHDGVPNGRRRHFIRVQAKDLIVGFERGRTKDPRREIAMIGVGVPGTIVRALEHDRLRQLAKPIGGLDAVNGLVDTWVRHVSDGLSPEGPPRACKELPGNTEVTLEAGEMAQAGPKTVWFQQLDGFVNYCGLSKVRPYEKIVLLPLTRASWFQAVTDVRLKMVDSANYFRADRQWRSLLYFHRVVIQCLGAARARDRQIEAQAETHRTARELNLIDDALDRLASIDTPTGKAIGSSENPLIQACMVAGASAGIEVIAPERDAPTVVDVARASHVQTRQVLLNHDWFKEETGAMVGFLGEENMIPVALIPTRGGFDVVDPATGNKVKATNDLPLLSHAHALYRSFPPRALSVFDLLKFGMVGNYKDAAMMILAGTLLGLFGMASPYALGVVIDSIIPSAEVAQLFQMGGLLICLAFGTALIQIARGVATLRIETRASAAMQAAVWDRVLGLPVPFFREYSTGDLAMRANGIDRIRQALSGTTLAAILSGLFSTMNFFLLLYYDATLAGVAALLALGSILISAVIGLVTVVAHRDLAESEGKLSSLVLQLLTGVSKLRMAGAENRAFGLWARLFEQKRSLDFRVSTLAKYSQVINSTYPVFTTIVVFYLAASGTGPKLGTGSFLAFYSAFGVFINGLLGVVGAAIGLLNLVPVWERALPILTEVPEVQEGSAHPGDLRGGIQISRVTFGYDPDAPPVLRDIDFTINPGEFVALIGSTAAGKSTLFRIMLGFEKPDSGAVFYDGQELGSLDIGEVRRQLGVVLQNGELIAGDIYENIIGSRNLTHEDAWEAARMAGMDQEIKEMPMQMHTVVSAGGKSLSGGQQQRLRIARAIATKPRIIYFDEATSALDNKTQTIVSESLERLLATRIVIAHRLSTIRNADRIIVLEHGRIVQMGTYEDLMQQEGVFKELAKRQVA